MPFIRLKSCNHFQIFTLQRVPTLPRHLQRKCYHKGYLLYLAFKARFIKMAVGRGDYTKLQSENDMPALNIIIQNYVSFHRLSI